MTQQAPTETGLLRPAEAGAELRLSRATIYRLIASGELDTVHVGVRQATRITREALRDYVARHGIKRSA